MVGWIPSKIGMPSVAREKKPTTIPSPRPTHPTTSHQPAQRLFDSLTRSHASAWERMTGRSRLQSVAARFLTSLAHYGALVRGRVSPNGWERGGPSARDAGASLRRFHAEAWERVERISKFAASGGQAPLHPPDVFSSKALPIGYAFLPPSFQESNFQMTK